MILALTLTLLLNLFLSPITDHRSVIGDRKRFKSRVKVRAMIMGYWNTVTDRWSYNRTPQTHIHGDRNYFSVCGEVMTYANAVGLILFPRFVVSMIADFH